MLARALTGAVHNVHAKDSRFKPHAVQVDGVLGTRSPERRPTGPGTT